MYWAAHELGLSSTYAQGHIVGCLFAEIHWATLTDSGGLIHLHPLNDPLFTFYEDPHHTTYFLQAVPQGNLLISNHANEQLEGKTKQEDLHLLSWSAIFMRATPYMHPQPPNWERNTLIQLGIQTWWSASSCVWAKPESSLLFTLFQQYYSPVLVLY